MCARLEIKIYGEGWWGIDFVGDNLLLNRRSSVLAVFKDNTGYSIFRLYVQFRRLADRIVLKEVQASIHPNAGCTYERPQISESL